MSTTRPESDLISVLTEAHRELETLLQELETTTTSPEHRRQLADHVITEFVGHAVAEERYLHPAVREYVPDGDRIVKDELAAHAEAEQAMSELENMSPADAQFELLVKKLIIDAREHVQHAGTGLLAELEQSCPEAERAELGAKIVETRRHAPGRPHPAEVERKSGKLILDPGTPLVSTVRAALTEN
ncbi:MAG: hemerythrin domain-containing protein [Kibdelosporangium sp.]